MGSGGRARGAVPVHPPLALAAAAAVMTTAVAAAPALCKEWGGPAVAQVPSPWGRPPAPAPATAAAAARATI
ncbi:hypothetical protein V8C86DRAFT_2470959 [Haematococcus lacustris]